MRYEIEAGGRTRTVAVDREDGVFLVVVDGREWHVDARRVDAHTLSLIIAGDAESGAPGSATAAADEKTASNGRLVGTRRTYEVTVTPDSAAADLVVRVGTTPVRVIVNGRRLRRPAEGGGGAAGVGPERIVAPMPGKVVRVLARAGDRIEQRQPIVVVEAMKMENELRARRAGTLVELHAREGASVDAGTLLAVIR